MAIDGGGIKGVVPASFLMEIEDSLGESVANYFDLVAGTSTGGIIALALGFGMKARDILRFYEELGPKVFQRRNRLPLIGGMLAAKYDAEPLRNALEETFGDRKLGESTKRLVVPALNLENGEVHLYKTSHHPKLERDYKESVVSVALATAAAPTYFPTHRSATGIPLIDGGIWANNPTGVAVVEAIGVLAWTPEDIRVLSLGCITEPLGIRRARWSPMGWSYWAREVVDVFMVAQSHASLGTAYVLVGHPNVLRISPVVERGRFRLDGVNEIPSLRGLGATEARKALPRLRQMFFTDRAEPFTPCHEPTAP